MKGSLDMKSMMEILQAIVGAMQFFVFAHVIMSWLINFQVLNLHQQFVAQIWYGLNRILEPAYSRIRDFLPQMGGLDLAPLVMLLGLYAADRIIYNNMPNPY